VLILYLKLMIYYIGEVSVQKQKIKKNGKVFNYERKRLLIPNNVALKLKVNQKYKISFEKI